jgi:isopenicillin N synthase-like dioxygenase
VQLPNGEWVHAPVVEGAFTINAGDMLAHWSGGRWRSAIHRMPAPTEPDDGLLSLVYFCDPDPDTMVVPLQGDAPPVLAGDYLKAKIAAITMQPGAPD